MSIDTKKMIEGLRNLQSTTEHLNSVNETALKALQGLTDSMDNEEAKKILAETTSGAQKILALAKKGDIAGITKVQKELMEKYGNTKKPEQNAG
jgi:hypothetical protein